MKQILQNLTNGDCITIAAPAPKIDANSLLITTTRSLISVGTEKMLVDFGKGSYLAKAKQQPEKVKAVLEKIQTDGLVTTLEAVKSKLASPIPLGYCNVGIISQVGEMVTGFAQGNRVVSNGPHADIVKVPKNLCALIPNEVDDDAAAFTVIASIALQGIRLLKPTLGESVAVIGVGLIGLLTVQLLRAHGCRVLAIDIDLNKLNLAKQFGAEIYHSTENADPINKAIEFSRGPGIDGVIITASTKSNDLVTQAARMSRKRGRIILVGVTGLKLNRADFYEKELSFQVSCSYGPGRYDDQYEQQGIDYPIGFVRWTEQRNFEAVLDLMAQGQLNVKPLITHNYLFEEAFAAYQALTDDKQALGILLHYQSDFASRDIKTVSLAASSIEFDKTKPIFGFIGAGNYASRQLIPAFKKAGAQLHTIICAGGISGVVHGKKAGFSKASTDLKVVLNEHEVNSIVIVTRHNSHAELVIKALEAHKHVFVEKPLAINLKELKKIEETYKKVITDGQKLHLMVGFNRRFAPHVQQMKTMLAPLSEPKSFIITVNAGNIPKEHWTQDPKIGGGRIIGEACHFIDLMRFLAGTKITSINAQGMLDPQGCKIHEDLATINLNFADGSLGSIHYFSNGAASFPKERIEVFVGGRILQLNNFRKLTGFGWKNFSKMNLWRQDKGQNQCALAFLRAIQNGTPSPIPVDELFEVAALSIEAAGLSKLTNN